MANEHIYNFSFQSNWLHAIMDHVNNYAVGNLFQTDGVWDDDTGEMIDQKLGTIVKSEWKFNEMAPWFQCDLQVVFEGETREFAVVIKDTGEIESTEEKWGNI